MQKRSEEESGGEETAECVKLGNKEKGICEDHSERAADLFFYFLAATV